MRNTEETMEMCLREMFRRVGLKYSRAFCKKDDWFRKRSWTDAECEDFKKWMVALLRKRHRWTVKMAEKEAGWFILMYSWRSPPLGYLMVKRSRKIR